MRLFLFSLFLFCLITTRAVASTLPEPVVAALRHAHIPLSAVSIVVQQTGAPDPLVSVNADRAVNPASTMKLLTTIASLETLGPAYRWKTEAYLDGKLENGVLQGDLVFKGYGDPKLTVEEFWMWLHELRQRGLREIRGDIVLDHSFFEAVKQDPAAFDHDPTRAYNVGTDALLLNFNAMHLHLIPDGHATRAMLEPDLDGYTVVNRITTSRRLRCGGAAAYKAHLEGHDIILEGRMPADCGEADEYFSLLPQDQYFFAVFSALWKELGGTVQGQLRVGNAPAGQVPFAMYVSPPLAEVIRDINKFSNNTMARQLFLTLGMADQVSANRDGLLSAGEKDGSGEYPMPLALGADSLQARQEGGDITDPDDAISSAPATLQQDDGEQQSCRIRGEYVGDEHDERQAVIGHIRHRSFGRTWRRRRPCRSTRSKYCAQHCGDPAMAGDAAYAISGTGHGKRRRFVAQRPHQRAPYRRLAAARDEQSVPRRTGSFPADTGHGRHREKALQG